MGYTVVGPKLTQGFGLPWLTTERPHEPGCGGPVRQPHDPSHPGCAGVARTHQPRSPRAVGRPWRCCRRRLDWRGAARFEGGAPMVRGGGVGQGGRGPSSPEGRRDGVLRGQTLTRSGGLELVQTAAREALLRGV
jgi:hypothetical protein